MPTEIFQYFLIVVIVFAVVQIGLIMVDIKTNKEYNDRMDKLTKKLWQQTAEINAKRRQEAHGGKV